MVFDFSWINNILPILVFLFVFLIIFSILTKTKVLGGNSFINSLVSFIIGIIFLTASTFNEYVATIVPWFVLIIIIIFFILVLVGFSAIEVKDIFKPATVWVFIIFLILILLAIAFNIFSFNLNFLSFLYSSKVLGGIVLLIIAGFVFWIITKK